VDEERRITTFPLLSHSSSSYFWELSREFLADALRYLATEVIFGVVTDKNSISQKHPKHPP